MSGGLTINPKETLNRDLLSTFAFYLFTFYFLFPFFVS